MEKFGSAHLEQNEVIPRYEATPEDVQRVKENIEYSNKLRRANDVLEVLDLPDEQEDSLRKTLIKLDDKTLEDLATKPKKEILVFCFQEQKKKTLSNQQDALKVETEEAKKQESERNFQAKENTRIETKLSNINENLSKIDETLSKIKSVFTSEILNKNPDIAEKFNLLDTITDPAEKDKVLKEVLNILKEPGRLKSIIDDLGGADKNNPQYVEFRNAIVGIDPSFESYFSDIESVKTGISLDANEVIKGIEKDSGGMIDIDLNANPPVSKMSLIGSSYSFEEEIKRQELLEVTATSREELQEVMESFKALDNFKVSFDELFTDIAKIWGKPNFQENLASIVNEYAVSIVDELVENYETMGIDSDIQIKESDISDLAKIDKADELRDKKNRIKEKFLAINSQLGTHEKQIQEQFKVDINELIKEKYENKERQMKVLEFLKSSGFDLIPKEITDKLITLIQSNSLLIPGIDLNIQNIDLKNGHFGESAAFFDSETGLNTKAKRNMLKFVNKMITGNIEEPLNVEAIVNGVSGANPAFMQNQFLEAGIFDSMSWKYARIVENLRKGDGES